MEVTNRLTIKECEEIIEYPDRWEPSVSHIEQLADTMIERDRYKELWENVHIFYSKSREEIEALSNKESE